MILATTMVFTFVALWHDLSFKLLAWGWLVSLFIVPELVGRALVPVQKYGARWWYRHIAACGGVANVLLMMGANLVGFVLGLDGMKHLIHELASTAHGWAFTAFACSCLFVGVQIMFEYREEEARKGVDRRC
jgi:D-alanyl-lipoteichoic acid acyltransferase DltB (MBOAT superfamily)